MVVLNNNRIGIDLRNSVSVVKKVQDIRNLILKVVSIDKSIVKEAFL